MTPPTLSPEAAKRLAESKRRYWRSNLIIMSVLLLIWAAAGFGCAVWFAEALNEFTLPGTAFPLGFWFAHLGAIVVFVIVVLVYCIAMNRLDRYHRTEMDGILASAGREGGR